MPREALAGGGDQLAADRTVDVQINRLRRKIEIRSRQSALAADGARPGLPAGDRAMTLWSASSNAITPALKVARAGARDARGFVAAAAHAFVLDRWPVRLVRGGRAPPIKACPALGAIMPKGLYVRALVIVIAPMVLLQSILAYVFMERHWQTVTERLSAALSQDIAALVDLDETLGPGKHEVLERIAAERLNLDVELMPPTPLPPPAPKPFFQFFDEALAEGDQAPDRAPLLGRHDRALEPHRDPGPAR